MKVELKILSIEEGTSVDGPGLRTSIYFAGCRHHCEGCHNPQSWDIKNGKPATIDELMAVIRYNEFPVTFSGGDPFFQVEEVTELAHQIKQQMGYNIWCYTGYLWEDLLKHPEFMPLLQQVDVIVDGPFILAKRDISLLFRGSSNQRIIDVQQSLATGTVVPAKF
ncbi:MAG: anaerobic ribonucleoside-triphosphate reductase activating protein [Bacteroidaceae bacterium]|nr:anaerobic ribonucleoside-triphosphate reductase activating protein [Bacteroidaceae bacterium]